MLKKYSQGRLGRHCKTDIDFVDGVGKIGSAYGRGLSKKPCGACSAKFSEAGNLSYRQHAN